VSKTLLERVFPVVYGVESKDVLSHEDLAVGSYRFAVRGMIPEMTQVALQTHKKEVMRETPDFAKRKFLYHLSRSDYEKQWGEDYVKPAAGTRILSTLLRYMPRIGPFQGSAFKNPTPQTEDLYFKSINTTVNQYRAFLEAVRSDTLVLLNCELRDRILQFYSDISVPIETKKDQPRWQGVLTALDELKSVAPVPAVAGAPAE
jgi:hypothetical protein